MNFLKRLASFFAGSSQAPSPKLALSARCNRCGEIVQGQVNLYNDLSIDYNDSGEIMGYHCRKVLMGSGRCFQQIEISLTFNAARQITDKQIAGGAPVEPASGNS